MRYKRLSVYLLLTLAACSSAQDSTKQVLDSAGDETSATWNKLRDLLDLGHTKEKKETPQPRYCYRTLQDVLCYHSPLPGQEYRLTGYQEANGKTGYVLPAHRHAPPDIAAAESLPPLKPLAAASVPPSTPSTPGQPPQKQLKEVIFDPAELEPKTLVPDKEQ